MNSVELFAGAGGLGMGMGLSGFDHKAVIEWDTWACDTIRENQKRGFPLVEHWPVTEGDVRAFDFSAIKERIDLVSGGPPCQPFSVGGKHRAQLDQRDMFPATVKAISILQPKAFVVENVRGLTREKFRNYFEYIKLQLTFPQVRAKKGETWLDHLSRLEERKTAGIRSGLHYEVISRVINAADYGIPQKRERVFIVGFRSDLEINWHFPNQTHSLEALLHDQWVTGDYWDRLKVAKKSRPRFDSFGTLIHRKIEKVKRTGINSGMKPWLTVREALRDLPKPNPSGRSKLYYNHKLQPGAKVYPGHTGSPLDMPAKTLKAGGHGVPGGENMMVLPGGGVRYFSVREAARLQTFPDNYVFHGSWSETMRQLGNAVPVALARLLSSSIAQSLLSQEETHLFSKMCRSEAMQ